MWHAIFTPGPWGRGHGPIQQVPCAPESLHTRLGLFLCEIQGESSTAIPALLQLLRDGIKLAVGDFESSFVPVLLFLTRLAVRCLTIIRSADSNPSVLRQTCARDLDAWLEEAYTILLRWQEEASITSRKDAECAFHAHMAMAAWTCVDHVGTVESQGGLSLQMAQRLLSSVAFVKTWRAVGDLSLASDGDIDDDNGSSGGSSDDDDSEPNTSDAKRQPDSDLDGPKEGMSLGVSDQEVFWLAQHRSWAMQSFLEQLHSDPQLGPVKLATMLTAAIRTATGEADVTWQPAEPNDLQTGAKMINGHFVSFTDAKGTFAVHLQSLSVTYKSKRLKPVPDLIARHPDFLAFFKGPVPHCATLSHLSERHEVFIPKGQTKVTWWREPPNYLRFPGCPLPPGSGRGGDEQVVESSHPYQTGESLQKTLTFREDVDAIKIRFDERSKIRQFYDSVSLSWTDKSTGDVQQVQYYPECEFDETPCFAELTIHAASVDITWESLAVGEADGNWGFRLVAQELESDAGKALEFNGTLYGGSPEREYRYGQEPPGDVPWLSSLLDPVLYSALTELPATDPTRRQWMEFSGRHEGPKDASQLTYLLPAEDVTGDVVLLLSRSEVAES